MMVKMRMKQGSRRYRNGARDLAKSQGLFVNGNLQQLLQVSAFETHFFSELIKTQFLELWIRFPSG